MKLLYLALLLTLTSASCKLMKKKDVQEKKQTHTSMRKDLKTPAWAHTTNIYEVNIRQYTPEGTFNAFAQHLPRLKDMGVGTLWFMPITPISRKNMKGTLGSYYACSDYTAINPEFGSLADFKNLVKQAHDLGFKVIIDWVANHTGWDHRWTREHPDYYLRDSATHDFKIASGMDDIIELDFENPNLVNAMIDAMKFWVKETDIDGFRCDLAAWVELPFWRKARPAVDSLKHLFWLGEFDELENPDYGHVFDASYTWTWMHKTEAFYKEHLPLSSITSVLDKYNALGDESMRAWFTSNHDENSWNGTEYEKYGNMAKALAVFSCTWNGIPLVYNGQELPMTAKRLEFFEKDTIPWTGSLELHDFYKTLFNLKNQNPALRAGDPEVTTYRVSTTDEKHAFVFLRKNKEREILVGINMSYTPHLDFEITDPNVKGTFKDVFTGNPASHLRHSLKAWEYFVWEK